MPRYTVDPPVGGPGWGLRRVGPCVLGYWSEPMTEERVQECARLYRAAHRAHGRFSVFAVFTATPFSLEAIMEDRTRRAAVSLINDFGPEMAALTCVIELPSGFRAAIARASAAAVTRVTHREVPFIFVDSRKEAYALARARGALDVVDEATHESHLAELKAIAEGAAKASARPRSSP